MRRGAGGKRRDASEPAIVDALKCAGASVLQVSSPNAPDLVVGFRGKNYLMEVKTDKGKVSKGQQWWAWTWQGGDVVVVREPQEALDAIGLKLRRIG